MLNASFAGSSGSTRIWKLVLLTAADTGWTWRVHLPGRPPAPVFVAVEAPEYDDMRSRNLKAASVRPSGMEMPVKKLNGEFGSVKP